MDVTFQLEDETMLDKNCIRFSAELVGGDYGGKRIVYLHTDASMLMRIITQGVKAKTVRISDVKKFEKSYIDYKELTVTVRTKVWGTGMNATRLVEDEETFTLVFTSPERRALFVGTMYVLMDAAQPRMLPKRRSATVKSGKPAGGSSDEDSDAMDEKQQHMVIDERLPRARVPSTSSADRSRGHATTSSPRQRPISSGSASRRVSLIRKMGLYDKRHSIFIGTWNVGELECESQVIRWIEPNKHDIYAIALQECTAIQNWIKECSLHIDNKSGNYKLLARAEMWEMCLFVVVRKSLVPTISHVETTTVSKGAAMGMIGNKGGVAISLQLKETALAFVGCHFQAREERLKERREDYRSIAKETKFGDFQMNLLNQFDHVFWFGDMNYRVVGLKFEEVVGIVKNAVEQAEEATKSAKQNDRPQQDRAMKRPSGKRAVKAFATLAFQNDQLTAEKLNKHVFYNFEEGLIDWPPTYRMERDKMIEFSNKRAQPPSYTDRILWKSLTRKSPELQIKSYEGCHDILGSDHRPVRAEFRLSPRNMYHTNDPSVLSEPNRVTVSLVLSNLAFQPDRPHIDDAGKVLWEDVGDLCLCFRSRYIDGKKKITGGTFDEMAELKGQLQWKWPSRSQADDVTLEPFINDKDFLQTTHIMITVRKNESVVIGYGALPLKKAFSMLGYNFRTTIMWEGLPVGKVKGKIRGLITALREDDQKQ